MGFTLAEAFVDIKGNDSPLTKDLARTKGKITGAARDMGKEFAKMFGEAMAGVGLGIGLGEMLKQTIEGERSISKLRASLRAWGYDVSSTYGKLNEFAESLRDVVNVDDDAARGLLALAVNMQVPEASLIDTTKAAIGLSEALGMDMTSALETVIKAQQGEFMMLQRQLPALKQMHTTEEKLAYIQKVATAGLKEKAEISQDLGGHIDHLKMVTSDYAKSLGQLAVPAINSATDALSNLVRTLTIGDAKNMIAVDYVTTSILSLDETLVQAQMDAKDFWASITGGTSDTSAQAKRLHELRQAVIAVGKEYEQHKKDEADGDKKDGVLKANQLKRLDKLADANRSAFSKMEDVWKHAQEAALSSNGVAALGNPAAPGAAAGKAKHNPNIEVHDRAWYAKEATRLRQHLESMDMDPRNREAMGDSLRHDAGARQQAEQDAYVKASKIAEFGSVAGANLENRLYQASQASRSKYQRGYDAISNKGAAAVNHYDEIFKGHHDDPSYQRLRKEAQDKTAADLDYYQNVDQGPQMQRQLQREKDRLNKAYGGAINKEQAELNTPIDMDATDARAAAQRGLIGRSDGRPVRVVNGTESELLDTLRALKNALPLVGGARP